MLGMRQPFTQCLGLESQKFLSFRLNHTESTWCVYFFPFRLHASRGQTRVGGALPGAPGHTRIRGVAARVQLDSVLMIQRVGEVVRLVQDLRGAVGSDSRDNSCPRKTGRRYLAATVIGSVVTAAWVVKRPGSKRQ